MRFALEPLRGLDEGGKGVLGHVLGLLRLEPRSSSGAQDLWHIGLDDHFERLRIPGADPLGQVGAVEEGWIRQDLGNLLQNIRVYRGWGFLGPTAQRSDGAKHRMPQGSIPQ